MPTRRAGAWRVRWWVGETAAGDAHRQQTARYLVKLFGEVQSGKGRKLTKTTDYLAPSLRERQTERCRVTTAQDWLAPEVGCQEHRRTPKRVGTATIADRGLPPAVRSHPRCRISLCCRHKKPRLPIWPHGCSLGSRSACSQRPLPAGGTTMCGIARWWRYAAASVGASAQHRWLTHAPRPARTWAEALSPGVQRFERALAPCARAQLPRRHARRPGQGAQAVRRAQAHC